MKNNESKPFSPLARANSFRYAFKGLKLFFTTQHNSWIHLFAACSVVAAGFLFGIAKTEWLFVIAAIALVLITEMLNTAIEFLVDLVSPEYNELAGKVKDLAAGAVLFAALMAVVIGVLVFGPYLLALLS
ncbi:MAG: diacylglycerol kinase family protein [Bacteroidia bacterium]